MTQNTEGHLLAISTDSMLLVQLGPIGSAVASEWGLRNCCWALGSAPQHCQGVPQCAARRSPPGAEQRKAQGWAGRMGVVFLGC